MEKAPKEEDLRGLDEEIESAIDRLFVEKEAGSSQSLLTEPAPTASSAPPEGEKDSLEMDLEALLPPLSDTKKPEGVRGRKPAHEEAPVPEKKPLRKETLARDDKPKPEEASVHEEAAVHEEPPTHEDTLELVLESLAEEPPRGPAVKEVDASIPAPSGSPNGLERLEAQILALEWEITEENIRRTGEQVRELRDRFAREREVVSILGLMDRALNQMMENDESIGPSLIRFLLDSKEMLKLLIGGKAKGDRETYRRLAWEGMEAKFSLVKKLNEKKVTPPAPVEDQRGQPRAVFPIEGFEKLEGTIRHLNSAVERIEATLRTMGEELSQLRREGRTRREAPAEPGPASVQVTVFRIDEKLFGIESHKILKLFRVPGTFEEKYFQQEKVRVRDFEVKLIDLKKMFSLPRGQQKGEMKILLVKDEEEVKGLVVGQVLKRLLTRLDPGDESGAYCSGTVHWTYQERPVAIPVLDVRKM